MGERDGHGHHAVGAAIDLEAQRDALAVENAKITAAAADEDKNKVAATMVDANSADFVKE